MNPSVDGLIYEMDRDPSNQKLQIRRISLFPAAFKSDGKIESFSKIIGAIKSVIQRFPSDAEILSAIADALAAILTPPSMVLEEIEIIISNFSQWKTDETASKKCLQFLRQHLCQYGNGFTSQYPQIPQILLDLSRLQPKSQELCSLACQISELLDYTITKARKKTCKALSLFSIAASSAAQQEIIVSHFTKISDLETLLNPKENYVAYFTKLPLKYQWSQPILSSALSISVLSPSEISDELTKLILARQESLSGRELSLAVEALGLKLPKQKSPPESIPLAAAVLSESLSEVRIVRVALRLCFNAIRNSESRSEKMDSLVSIVSNVLLFHSSDTIIAKRCSAIFELLCSFGLQAKLFEQSSTSIILLRSAFELSADEKAFHHILSSLKAIINLSPSIKNQINRPEFVHQLRETLKSKTGEDGALLICIIWRLIGKTVPQFTELSGEERAQYLVESKICRPFLMNNDAQIVKAAFCLSDFDGSNQDMTEKVMEKFPTDKEIQLLGLWRGASDIEAITNAVTLIGTESIKFVKNRLIEKPEITTKLIDFLINLDRKDAVDILISKVEKYSEYMTAHFSFQYPSQITLASIISKGRQEQDASLSNEVVGLAALDPSVLSSAIFLCSECTPDVLVEVIQANFDSDEIIAKAAQLFLLSNATEYPRDSVKAISLAIQSTHKEENYLPLLKVLHLLSSFAENDRDFIPLIQFLTRICKIDFCNEICSIFANISRSDLLAEIIRSGGYYSIAFQSFGVSSIRLLYNIRPISLTPEQFSNVLSFFLSNSTSQPEADLSQLIHILLSSIDFIQPRPFSTATFHSILTLHPQSPDIVIGICRLSKYSEDISDDSLLLSSMTGLLPLYARSIEVILAIFECLPLFKGPLSEKIILAAAVPYLSDPYICSTLFSLLRSNIAVNQALEALKMHKDIEIIKLISKYLLQISQSGGSTPQFAKAVAFIERNRSEPSICSDLLSIVCTSSFDSFTHQFLVKYSDYLQRYLISRANELNICRSVLQIFANLSKSEFEFSPSKSVNCATRIWAHADVKIVVLSAEIVKAFALRRRGREFESSMVFLARSVRRNTESVMDCLFAMAPYIRESSGIVAEQMLLMMKGGDVKAAKVLLSICKCENALNSIYVKAPIMIEAVEKGSEVQPIALEICNQLKDPQKITAFGPMVPILIRNLKGRNTGAANCLLSFASVRPSMVVDYLGEIVGEAKGLKGDAKKLCESIIDRLSSQ